MPRFDGTGPQGSGPLTGRGDGYCAVKTSPEGRPSGLAGIEQRPFGGFLGRFVSWVPRLGGRGRRAGRGRGRRR
jgi:hypothetical protein